MRDIAIPKEGHSKTITGMAGIILSLFVIYYAFIPFIGINEYGIAFLTGTTVTCGLLCIRDAKVFPKKPDWNLRAAVILTVLSLLVGLYFFIEYPQLSYQRVAVYTVLDYILAAVILYLALQLTWLTSGKAIPIVIMIFMVYGFMGSWIPDPFYHQSFSLKQMLKTSCLSMTGIYGKFIQVGGTWIAIFVIYASIIQGFGGLDYIMKVIRRITRGFKYGIPQLAVVSSMVFGTFSGSAPANAAGTGVITIPIMKKAGIKPTIAGAIEGVASSGGQIMPPVMGAAAFFMADFLGMPYIEIVLRAFIPGIIFYLVVAMSVHLATMKTVNLKAFVGDAEEKLSVTYWLRGVPIIVSLAILMFMLSVLQVGVSLAGFCLITSFLVMQLIYGLAVSRKVSSLRQFGINLINGLKAGGLSMAELGLMTGCLGIVVGILIDSGLGQSLSWIMVDLSGGSLIALTFLVALVSILLGMAVTTAVVYVIVVMLAAPAMLRMGVPLVSTHFIVFYLGMLSAITPPVALATAVTSKIAGASYIKTSWEAMKLGMPIFVMPFIFLTQPDLLAGNIHAFGPGFFAFSGLTAVSVALLLPTNGMQGILIRCIFGACGSLILFATPGSLLAIVAWVPILIITGWALVRYRQRKAEAELANARG